MAAIVLASLATSSSAQQGQGAEVAEVLSALAQKRTLVETHIHLAWSDDQPVVGAKVFHHGSNTLLGVTDGSGRLLLTLPNGTVLRLVEPTYGQQQSLQVVQARPKTNKEMMSTTSTSGDIYVMRDVWMTF